MMKKVYVVVDTVLLFKFNLLLIIVNVQAALKFKCTGCLKIHSPIYLCFAVK